MLKVGTAALVLEMIEAGVAFRDFSLDNPIRAIREVSHDLTGRRPVRLAGGRQASALDIQREYYARAVEHLQTREPNAQIEQVVDLWGRQLDAVESQDFAKVDTEIDWVIKRKLFQRYQDRYNMELSDPKIAQLDLAYHDIKRGRGVFDLLQRKGLAARITTDEEIDEAVNTPPQTTRAKLRGEFISAAQAAGRDFTVDWVHLKLNDQAQRTVLCKDPFRSVDERVKRLIASHVAPKLPMGISKVERLMNLVIALLSTRGYITAERIRASVYGYGESPSDEAFSRMFERDKNELRDLGIPLETGRVSALDPTEGYRINRDAYALPDIDLTPDEAAAVAVATQLWESPELITAAQGAVLKLRAAGVDVDPDAAMPVHAQSGLPGLRGSEDVLGILLAAIDAGQVGHVRSPAVAHRALHHPHRSNRGAWSPRAAAGTWWGTTATATTPGPSGCPASAPR